MPATKPCPQCHGTCQDTAHTYPDGTPAACETCHGYGTTTPPLHHSTPTMPRELLLPIPHAIADKVHHLFLAEANVYATTATVKTDGDTAYHTSMARSFKTLAEKLDTLAREAGVIGW